MAGTGVNELKTALWDAANTLRGSAVDRTDWKGYILPLLFFKRISDVWDEETAEAAEPASGSTALVAPIPSGPRTERTLTKRASRDAAPSVAGWGQEARTTGSRMTTGMRRRVRF